MSVGPPGNVPSWLQDVRKYKHGERPSGEPLRKLETAANDLIKRMQRNPDPKYLMNQDEFSLMEYASKGNKETPRYKEAIARFWEHYRGIRPSSSNLGASSSSKSGNK